MKQIFTAWLLSLFACTLLASAPVSAQEVKRVVVLEFDGKGAGVARSAAISALRERSEVELVSSKEAEAARQKVGGNWSDAQTFHDVGAELGVAVFVQGNVQKAGAKVTAVLRVRDASTGLVAHEEPWTRKALPQLKAISGNFWQVFGSSILAASAPTQRVAEPEPVAQVEEPEETQAEASFDSEASEPRVSGDKTPSHPALVVWAGPRLMWRSLSYDDPTTSLFPYRNAGASPAVNVALGFRWFPGAHLRGDGWSDIGFEGELDYTMGLKSKLPDGSEVSTTAYEFSAGALYRVPLEFLEPVIRVGYVRHAFDPSVPAATPSPATNYSAIRIGVGTAISFTDWLGIDLGASYLHVLDTGDLGSAAFAPELSARAFELSGGIFGYIKEVYGIRVAADFRRYAFDLGENPSSAFTIAGSGSDHYVRVTTAFMYRLGGVEKPR